MKTFQEWVEQPVEEILGKRVVIRFEKGRWTIETERGERAWGYSFLGALSALYVGRRLEGVNL